MLKLRDRLTFANVVSMLALFVALGGSSYAAITLKRNSVKAQHIAANAVSGPKVKNASLLAKDFAPGQLPRGENGDTGAPGATGSPGSPGSPGAPGSPAASLVMGNTTVAMGETQATSSALSPSGASAISGSTINRAQGSSNATIVVRDLSVTQSGPSGANGNFVYRLVDITSGSEVTLLTCSIAGASGTTCDSGAQSATVPAGSRLYFQVSQNGTGATAGRHAGWGFRATTP